jgi:hypothetical protein
VELIEWVKIFFLLFSNYARQERGIDLIQVHIKFLDGCCFAVENLFQSNFLRSPAKSQKYDV